MSANQSSQALSYDPVSATVIEGLELARRGMRLGFEGNEMNAYLIANLPEIFDAHDFMPMVPPLEMHGVILRDETVRRLSQIRTVAQSMHNESPFLPVDAAILLEGMSRLGGSMIADEYMGEVTGPLVRSRALVAVELANNFAAAVNPPR